MTNLLQRRPSLTEPRGLTLSEAAAFAGVTANDFKGACERGEYPTATLAFGRFDRKLLERHMDRLSGIFGDEPHDPLLEWERRRAARQT